MKNVEEIKLRASGAGNLMTDKKGTVLTENQEATLKKYEDTLRAGGSITAKQKETMIGYQKRRDAPVELADTAKTFVQDQWLLNNKGFWKQTDTKFTEKGLFGEEDSITMLTELDGVFYKKNTERITKGHLTGECDIVSSINGNKVIQDTKTCWDPRTFMNADMSKIYEWQLRVYMYLYDADEAWLRYCLTDCPSHIFEYEKYKLKSKFGIIDDSLPEVKPLFDQLERNLMFTNSRYSLEEKVKTYKIKRDDEIFQKLMDRIPGAVEYYKSIKLNQLR